MEVEEEVVPKKIKVNKKRGMEMYWCLDNNHSHFTEVGSIRMPSWLRVGCSDVHKHDESVS